MSDKMMKVVVRVFLVSLSPCWQGGSKWPCGGAYLERNVGGLWKPRVASGQQPAEQSLCCFTAARGKILPVTTRVGKWVLPG